MVFLLFYRFIPAGAGNTPWAVRGAPTVPVYSRWRGEHFKRNGNVDIDLGLFPLARGTLTAEDTQELHIRLFPLARGTH
ncbi:hypothetical protein LQX20_002813 [Salmonella enterica]|nr:hypothetical protein [Salmonella enterica]